MAVLCEELMKPIRDLEKDRQQTKALLDLCDVTEDRHELATYELKYQALDTAINCLRSTQQLYDNSDNYSRTIISAHQTVELLEHQRAQAAVPLHERPAP